MQYEPIGLTPTEEPYIEGDIDNILVISLVDGGKKDGNLFMVNCAVGVTWDVPRAKASTTGIVTPPSVLRTFMPVVS